MQKWKVEGRIRADILFEEEVEASTESAAVKKAQARVYQRCRITSYDVLDDEIYAEVVK